MKALIIKSTLVLMLGSFFAFSAQAQMTAPFAGGVKLQQGGAVSPAMGLSLKASNTTPYTSDVTLNFVQPTTNGFMKIAAFGANAGNVVVSAIDLTTDIGASILPIANGGTGSATAIGALTNLLPSQGGNSGKFLTTNGTTSSWGSPVTSVGLALPAELTVSNSPVTTTGTLTAAWASQTANKIFASPDGAPGAPSFRTMTANDVPSLDASKITTGTFSASMIPNLDASKITTGTLAVARGGTGSTSFTGNAVIVSNAAGTALTSQSLTNGQIIIGSTGAAPVAATITAGSGISITNGAGSITISSNANGMNKARVNLNAAAVSYTANAAPAGFTFSATSVVNITILEAGGYPITATVTNINTVLNTFDFVISGYPTAGSTALVSFQN